MKIKLNKIPSVFKNTPLPKSVTILPKIKPVEGSVVVVEAQDHEGKLNILDFKNGRLGKFWQWDKIPAVLGYRKATTEFAGFIPQAVSPGDELYLLCESGIVGAISGVYESWGRPMKVKVLGSIADKNNTQMMLKKFKISNSGTIDKIIPLIIFLGTRMDSGKTTMACKIAHYLCAQGKKIAGVKLTGVAFTQDLYKLQDAGAYPVYDFVDMGLPSTCSGKSETVIKAALNLINLAKKNNPDCILVEFGDAVMGEYHVADILQNIIFKMQIKMVILAANDFAGIKGTYDILASWGIKIDLVTGPIANSKVGIDLINKYFGITAESNQNQLSKTLELIKEKIWSK